VNRAIRRSSQADHGQPMNANPRQAAALSSVRYYIKAVAIG